ncbi:solute carrier family 45, member 1/2/4 [Blastomyces parvus]|uniref:Solute carrier family 45, member 1/2/4 n=1 Tax=Blastomyces parvus TaxID=2060905 RepID=A0A2B7XBX5_9EURO|nr:solute carrier family 45, member 1/2/4 [Blastomyces parvus]
MNSSLPDRESDRSPLLGAGEQASSEEAAAAAAAGHDGYANGLAGFGGGGGGGDAVVGDDGGGDDDDFAKEVCTDAALKSSLYLFLLTLSIGGLQIVWSVELSNGSPYLLSLGMDKSLLAFVWIAGPLTGTLVQPYVGIRSDNCRISWGKRKPFMIGGGIATIVSLLALAWTREMVGGVLGIFGVPFRSTGVKVTSIVVATILMYCLDFAINTVQAAIRAFIVDNAPAHQQESANAWASRLTGIGNILGYISGYLDLPKILPFFGKTQFQVLCMIASLALSITLLISCLYITERDPRLEGPPSSENPGVVAFFKQVFHSIRNLPPQIRKVCEIQLFAWIGWFPFLFYITTYIGQLYVNPIFEEHPHLTPEDIDEAWVTATRVGTFALLVYAVISFAASIILPLLVVPTYRPTVPSRKTAAPTIPSHPYLTRRASTSTISITAASVAVIPQPAPPPQLNEPLERSDGEGRPSLLSRLQIPGFTLRRAWFMSHILFSLCMFSTFFISTPQAGTVIVSIVGIPWALTLWAPFALISAEVARSDAKKRRRRYRLYRASPGSSEYRAPSAPAGPREREQHSIGASRENCSDGNASAGERESREDVERGVDEASGLARHSAASTSTLDPVNATSNGKDDKDNAESSDRGNDDDDNAIIDEDEEDEDEDADADEDADDENDTTDQAGVILGIHNVAVSFPQILSTLMSSLIFSALQKPRGEPGDDSVGWVLRFGGLATIGAAVVTKRLAEGRGGGRFRKSGGVV